MQIRRQVPNATIAKPPSDINKNKYGEIFATIEGQLYCRDNTGVPKSIASTAKYAEDAKNAQTVNNYTVGKDVPSNASFNNTTYSFSEGTTNGAFRVDWSIAGPTQERDTGANVKIHGLGSAAYAEASNFATKSDLRNVDASTLGGSSLSQILRYIDQKTNSSTSTFPWG